MTAHYAILQGQKVIEVDDALEWAKQMDDKTRRVAITHFGDNYISTVFLGLNHQWMDGEPLWFETLVFGGFHNGKMDRYSTWEEAEKGHKDFVDLLTRFPDSERDA